MKRIYMHLKLAHYNQSTYWDSLLQIAKESGIRIKYLTNREETYEGDITLFYPFSEDALEKAIRTLEIDLLDLNKYTTPFTIWLKVPGMKLLKGGKI